MKVTTHSADKDHDKLAEAHLKNIMQNSELAKKFKEVAEKHSKLNMNCLMTNCLEQKDPPKKQEMTAEQSEAFKKAAEEALER